MTANPTQGAEPWPFSVINDHPGALWKVITASGTVITEPFYKREDAQRLCDRLNAAPTTPGAPDWVLVPREPTEAMLKAFRNSGGKESGWGKFGYRAMLSAAPSPAPTAQDFTKLMVRAHYSGRNIVDAAYRLANASAEEVQTIAAHDWDMIREVAAMFLSDRRGALFAEKKEGSCHGR